MTHILLTHGYFLSEDEKELGIMRPYPPLGLLSLVPYLRGQGHEAEFFDGTFSDRSSYAVRLDETRATVVGLYANLTMRAATLDMIKMAKASGKVVILGGPEPAAYPAEYFAAGADLIIPGEGEATLAEALDAIDAASPSELLKVSGLLLPAANDRYFATPTRLPIINLDRLPIPERQESWIRPYLDAWRKRHGETSLNVSTARGCPYRCGWCSKGIFGNTYRHRSPASVVAELEDLMERFDPDQIWYVDDVFTLDEPRIVEWADLMEKRALALPFEAITRADCLQSEETAHALARMGCRRLWIGSESGSESVLRRMGRGVTPAQIRHAISLAKAQGITVGIFLMWGYPGETPEDIEATIEHVVAAAPDTFFTTVVHPMKGTPLYEEVEHRLVCPGPWAEITDRDLSIRGRPGREYYRLADQWLKEAVKAAPAKGAAEEARLRFFAASVEGRT